MRKHTISLLAALLTFWLAEAQITPFVELQVRGKQDLSHARYEYSALPYSNSRFLIEPGLSAGLVWEGSGLGLQLELRRAAHNGRFRLKQNPLYPEPVGEDVLDFGLGGFFVPLSLSWQTRFGQAQNWGIRARAGAGPLFIDQYEILDNNRMEGRFSSTVTGSEQPFDWEIVAAGRRSEAFMADMALGAFVDLTPGLELFCQASVTQSFTPLAFQRLWYWDHVNDTNLMDIHTQGQSLGLQLGIRYNLASR